MSRTAAEILATFAAELAYEDIPAAVSERACDCIIDTIGAAAFGRQFPWSRKVIDYVCRYGSGGACSVVGFPELRIRAPGAAFANGVLAHAFELDSGTDTDIGVHPGATLFPALLAMCEETRTDGRTAVTAFVAGCEVMFRIALAARQVPEKLGFHSPGLNGTYGAAVTAGRVLGLDAKKLANAIGIAGSLSSGLLAFAGSRDGAMVKRLHLGRAAEAGVLAARLAASGYAGPETVLEGRFGFLDAYARGGDAAMLTAGLRREWQTSRTCLKRYACNMNAHTAVQAVRELMSTHTFGGADVFHVIVEGGERMLSHHNITEPADIMTGQYSVPFCVAVALFHDPDDPRSFTSGTLENEDIGAACRKIELRLLPERARHPRSTRVTVRLKDGRELVRSGESFRGMPASPFSPDQLREKFIRLSSGMGESAASQLFEKLKDIPGSRYFALS